MRNPQESEGIFPLQTDGLTPLFIEVIKTHGQKETINKQSQFNWEKEIPYSKLDLSSLKFWGYPIPEPILNHLQSKEKINCRLKWEVKKATPYLVQLNDLLIRWGPAEFFASCAATNDRQLAGFMHCQNQKPSKNWGPQEQKSFATLVLGQVALYQEAKNP